MFKNVTSQKLIVFAFDSTTNAPKTGDAANITAYVSKDFGAVTVLGDTSATEMDATNAKGYYLFDLTQAETNGDTLLFSAKSSTANIVVVGAPATVYTFPTTGILAPATAGRTLVVDANGLADATTVKVGPTGAATAQTARDLGLGRIQKNAALAKFEFLMTDSTNHNPLTGATVSVTRSIDGAAFASGTLSAVTEVSNGMYYVDFGAGDLNGNVITLRCTATGADDAFITLITSP